MELNYKKAPIVERIITLNIDLSEENYQEGLASFETIFKNEFSESFHEKKGATKPQILLFFNSCLSCCQSCNRNSVR